MRHSGATSTVLLLMGSNAKRDETVRPPSLNYYESLNSRDIEWSNADSKYHLLVLLHCVVFIVWLARRVLLVGIVAIYLA